MPLQNLPNISRRQGYLFAVLVLMAGAGLRLKVFVENRSLFIDEANLARNIMERSWAGFFQNLDYDQYAPPLYLCIVKVFALLLGGSEWALRAWSLLCGLATLWVLFLFTKRLSKDHRWWWYPLFLLAFTVPYIQYATEVKQYACDVLVALGLSYLALFSEYASLQNSKNTLSFTLLWSLIGGVVVWLSMPSVFVLAAIGLAWLWTHRHQPKWVSIIVVGAVWLLSFGSYYWVILQGDIGDDNLKGYHAHYFFPLFPTTIAEWEQAGKLVRQFFGNTFGATAMAIGWGVLSVLLGIKTLFQNHKKALWILVLPMLLAIAVSGFHYYSLITRMTLFFLPNLMLLSLVGTVFLYQKANHWLFKFLVVAIVFVLCINKRGLHYVRHPMQMEELRPLLYQITEQTMPDILYIHPEAVPAYRFYIEHSIYQSAFANMRHCPTIFGHWQVREAALSDFIQQEAPTDIGLVFSHSSPEEIARVVAVFQQKHPHFSEIETYGTRYVLLKQ